MDFYQDLDLHGNRVSGLGEPAASGDGATKSYVDARQGPQISGGPDEPANPAVGELWVDTAGSESGSGAWVRPADWLPLPEIAPGDQRVVGLFAVTDDESNFLALTALGAYTVDWGDGTVENFASGAQANHLYSYAAISAETACSRGYRQVVVQVYPQAGQNLTSVSLQNRHPMGTPAIAWLDISTSAAPMASLVIGGTTVRMGVLEQVQLGLNVITNFTAMLQGCPSLQSALLDTSNGTNFTSMFNNCYSLQSAPPLDTSNGINFTSMFQSCSSLQSVPPLNTSNGTSFSNMFQGCSSLRSAPPLDTSNGTNFTSMFQACSSLESVPFLSTGNGTSFNSMFTACFSLRSVPPLDTSKSANFNSMFNSCYSLQSVPSLDTSNGGTFSSMFGGCSSLQSVPPLNTSSGTGFGSMFSGCYSLNTVPPLDTSKGTSFSGMFSTCPSLARGRLEGTKASISYSGCKLSAVALVDIFDGLATVTGQTITITGNHGAADLTPAQRAIATNKGWTIIG